MGHRSPLVDKTAAHDHAVVINSISPAKVVRPEHADVDDPTDTISERVNSTVRTRRKIRDAGNGPCGAYCKPEAGCSANCPNVVDDVLFGQSNHRRLRTRK